MNKQMITILVAEDDETMLFGIRDLLEIMDVNGYEIQVLTAENGSVALEWMEKHTPDIIISDINMPVMDGYAFFDVVRQHREWLYIPFVFLTAQGEREEIHQGRTSGVDLYITKPFYGVHLIELIKTQLEKAENRRLRRERDSQNLKEGILKILNHEFRTPLTYVTASYEMLVESVSTHANDQYFHDYLRGIQAGCVRLTSLVDDLIMVIELRTGEVQIEYKENACVIEDITAVITPIIQRQEDKHAADEPPVRICAKVGDDLPAIWAVPAYIQQIVEHLLTNAIKFTRNSGDDKCHIELTITADDAELRISVCDEGIGIPEHMQRKIFDVFFQYNRDYLEQQGAGMGLAIVDGLVNLHGGRVEVESLESVGSTFTVVLPVHRGQVLDGNGLETAVYRRKATILVVEDDPFLLRGLLDLLDMFIVDYDIHVASAANGRLALDILETLTPTLILSDIMMPEMDGYGLLKNVRENPAWINIPFIFLSARGEREDVFQGLQSGAELYITKPYDSDELLDLVSSELDKYFEKQGEQAQGFDELKRNILSLMSFDFRMPLADVSRHSESLSQGLAEAQTDQTMKESLRGIQAGNASLTRLIENFIALAELKTGETAVAYQFRADPIFDTGLSFSHAIQGQLDFAVTRNITCYPAFVDQETPAIYGDLTLLYEAFRRLMIVGLHYFPVTDGSFDQPQELHQEVAYDAVKLQLFIRFTVPPSAEMQMLIERILTEREFDLTNQIEYAPDLIIAKGYVELNNGRLYTTTNSDGFTFVITLPTYTIPDYDENSVS